MPRSSASWMVRIDCASSVPPHIHPPIAQVPRPMRETLSGVPVISMDSMRGLIELGRAVIAVEVISEFLSNRAPIGESSTAQHNESRHLSMDPRAVDLQSNDGARRRLLWFAALGSQL